MIAQVYQENNKYTRAKAEEIQKVNANPIGIESWPNFWEFFSNSPVNHHKTVDQQDFNI